MVLITLMQREILMFSVNMSHCSLFQIDFFDEIVAGKNGNCAASEFLHFVVTTSFVHIYICDSYDLDRAAYVLDTYE